ncbi:MAG: O-unit flippase-like protein [Negativicutes bacterium]|jgi:O-antigen/teichoic acid export membrane protein
MNIKLSLKDIIWSYLGVIIKAGANLIILPVCLRYMSADEMGMFYIFMSINAMMLLFDLGFSPTITRFVSYAFGGAKLITGKGFLDAEQHGQPNFALIGQLMRLAKKIYLIISLAVLIVLAIFGSIYIDYVGKALPLGYLFTAWAVFLGGIVLNLFNYYWAPCLVGIGKVKLFQKANVYSQVFYLLMITVSVPFVKYPLVCIAVAYALSGIIMRSIAKYYLKISVNMNDSQGEKTIQNDKTVFAILFANARKIVLVTVGSLLVNQGSMFLCSIFFSISTVASFGLTTQLFAAVATIGATYVRTFLPAINEASMRNNHELLVKLLAKSVVVGWSIFLCGVLAIVVVLPHFILLLKSHTELLPAPLLLLVALYMFLEFNHGQIFALFIYAKNEIPFVIPSLVSGCAIVIIAVFNVKILGYGLVGILSAQFLVQAVFQNWYWPRLVLTRMNIRMDSLLVIGAREFVNILRR